jgi:hypothetical protein
MQLDIHRYVLPAYLPVVTSSVIRETCKNFKRVPKRERFHVPILKIYLAYKGHLDLMRYVYGDNYLDEEAVKCCICGLKSAASYDFANFKDQLWPIVQSSIEVLLCAMRYNQLDVLEYVQSNADSKLWNTWMDYTHTREEEVVDAALASGNINIVKNYVRPIYLKTVSSNIIIHRHLPSLVDATHVDDLDEIIQYLKQYNECMAHPVKYYMIVGHKKWSEIIDSGSIKLLEMYLCLSQPCLSHDIQQHIKTVKMLECFNKHFEGRGICTLTIRDINIYAKYGRIELVQYLRNRGCPWDPSTFAAAASRHGNIEMLECLRSGGCLWSSTVYLSVVMGDVETLEWLKVSGCPLTSETLETLQDACCPNIMIRSYAFGIVGPTGDIGPIGMQGPPGPIGPGEHGPIGDREIRYMYQSDEGDEYGPRPREATYRDKQQLTQRWITTNRKRSP